MAFITVTVDTDLSKRFDKLPEEVFDDTTMTKIHQALKLIMNYSVPKKSGNLRTKAVASADAVTYPGPYAAYQHEGIVYAPNIPIFEDGVITGWRSKAPKHPTKRKLGTPGVWLDKQGNVIWEFGYSKPNTGDHWEERAMNERKDRYLDMVANIVRKRLSEINGS